MDLNDRTIRGLPLEEDRSKADKVYLDDTLTGFGLRCRNGKQASWVVQYRAANGQQVRATLDSVKKIDAITARKAAKQYLAQVTVAKAGGGIDPREAKRKQRAQRSFASVVEDYLQVKQTEVRPRTFIEAKRYLTDPNYWRPFNAKPIGSIKKDEVATRLNTIAKSTGPVATRRAQVNLSALYAWAMSQGLCELNPVVGTKVKAESPPRNRVLTDSELVAIWNAAENDDYGHCLKLLTLLGQRRGEIGGMRWSELDLDAGLWSLPAERVKNAQAHVVPLSDYAMQIIKSVPRRGDRDQLFGFSGIGFRNWGKAADRLNARIKPPIDAWRVHDLRRTAATGMAELGTAPYIVEQALNHQSGAKAGVAGIYNKSKYPTEVRTALVLWADHVRALVEGGARKVVSLKAAR